jgi:hypothetical protein
VLSVVWHDRLGVIMGYATGEARELPLRPTFDRRIKLEYHGAAQTRPKPEGKPETAVLRNHEAFSWLLHPCLPRERRTVGRQERAPKEFLLIRGVRPTVRMHDSPGGAVLSG